jgi:hypothetical protein
LGSHPFSLAALAAVVASGGAAVARAEAPPGAAEAPPATYAEHPERARPPPLLDDVSFDDLPGTPAEGEAPPPAKERRVDLGTAAILVTRLAQEQLDGEPTKVSYDPAPGVSLYARIVVHDYFQVGLGWQWTTHGMRAERGALGVDGSVEEEEVTSYSLAFHLRPTLPLGDRVRLWASAGLGWGRLYFEPMRASDASGTYVIRDRAASFVDFPIGLGGMVELVPSWLSLDLDVTAAPSFPDDGSAHVPVSTIDGAGRKREVGPLPGAAVTFVQAVGLSVLL